MGRILEELYSGDLQPAENRNWDDPEYEVKCEASLEEVHAFCERLDEESREAFDTMMEIIWSCVTWRKPRHFLTVSGLERG